MLLKIEAFFVLKSNISKYNYAKLVVFCNVNYAWFSKSSFGFSKLLVIFFYHGITNETY
jgi:hypothetical protein